MAFLFVSFVDIVLEILNDAQFEGFVFGNFCSGNICCHEVFII